MRLWIEVLILALSMTVACALPFHLPVLRRHSRAIFLVGTGAMFGICFFDLVPDVLAVGGHSSLLVMGLVWLAYTVIHLLHLTHHHHHEQHPAEDGDGDEFEEIEVEPGNARFAVFFGSLFAHCFASGMLLTVASDLSARIAGTVFAALLAHKLYESLLLSSILMVQPRSARWRAGVIAAYALALPLGAGATALFHGSINQEIAMFISSVAVGSLLGCLIFDFLLPSIRHLREQRFNIGWLLAGLLLTQLVMRQL